MRRSPGPWREARKDDGVQWTHQPDPTSPPPPIPPGVSFPEQIRLTISVLGIADVYD